jgi:hypothetical protein
MNQQFIQYIHDVEKLAPRFKTTDWAGQLSMLFSTLHEDLWRSDPEAYEAAFEAAYAEVKRVLGIEIKDLSVPF